MGLTRLMKGTYQAVQEMKDRESRAMGGDGGVSEVASLFGEQSIPGGIRLRAILRESTIVYEGILSKVHCRSW